MWIFETAPNASYFAPIEELQKFNITELLADMARFVAAKCSVEAVKNCFAAIDESNSKCVDAEDFRWGMIDLGYNLSKNEAEEVVFHFDKSGSGKLNYEDLIAKLCVSDPYVDTNIVNSARHIHYESSLGGKGHQFDLKCLLFDL